MLEGSQLPAELRMNQLLSKLGETSAAESNINTADYRPETNPQSFKAMVAMMQNQMMGEALVDPNDKDSSNPMGMNQMMAMGSMNPMMMQMMMMQGGGSGMMDPMMMAMNPMMMSAMMGSGQLTQNNFYPQTANSGQMVFPVQGKISSEYGHREHPINGHEHFHTGVDIAAPKGSPIRMPYDGKVVYVGHVSGFGDNTVIVAHENQVQADGKILYSIFGHNDKALVQQGEQVKAGEIFATVGSEGKSTGPHLHWETRIAPVGVTGTRIFERNLSMTVNPMSLA